MSLRNQFYVDEKYGIPKISSFGFENDELDNLRLIGFDAVRSGKDTHFDRIVHFFLYDYNFECIWKNPDKYIETLKKYKAVLTPDFSMYIEMAKPLQIYNTFRNRWCGAYLASKRIPIIPTISWGEKDTFDFCFEGVETGSIVAVSTYMVSEHNNHSDQKEFFMAGYNEMLRRINPQAIICYNTPFPEMEGNIIFIDYDLSSWRHYKDDLMNKKFENYGTIIKKTGFVLIEKGMGSVYAENGNLKKKTTCVFLVNQEPLMLLNHPVKKVDIKDLQKSVKMAEEQGKYMLLITVSLTLILIHILII